jgi:hypothetical protein
MEKIGPAVVTAKSKERHIYFSCRGVPTDQENEPELGVQKDGQSSAARFTKRDRVKFRANVPPFARVPTSPPSR